MGSCHGLVCLTDCETQLRLVNPVLPEEKQSVTLEHLMVRDPLLSTHDVYFDADYFDIDGDYLLSSVEWPLVMVSDTMRLSRTSCSQ
ncbi:unnamed protein product [Linum trigynum]|uniref:Uncharacterized protein n=1 Tax=Linum trigynum TaxID=586398 RepID=A0AAV2CMA9_9ROSI